MENEKKSGDKYSKLAGNTLIFAISSFSSKLLTLIVQPFLTYACLLYTSDAADE